MKLSIVTINLNNEKGLVKTIESVVNQLYNDFEYILIDGGSTDKSLNIINRFENKISFWVSEPDKGIYDAMNKGIQKSKGDYILFLNSGDVLHDNEVLGHCIKLLVGTDIATGKLKIDFNEFSNIVEPHSKIDLSVFINSFIAHPATFFKRELFDNFGFYDISFKIAADLDFFFRVFTQGRIKYYPMDRIVSIHMADGISSSSKFEKLNILERERILSQTPEFYQPLLRYGVKQSIKGILFLKFKIALKKKAMRIFKLLFKQ